MIRSALGGIGAWVGEGVNDDLPRCYHVCASSPCTKFDFKNEALVTRFDGA